MSRAVGIESRLDRWVRAGGEGGHAPGAPQRGGRRPFFFEVGARQPRTRTYPERGTYRGSGGAEFPTTRWVPGGPRLWRLAGGDNVVGSARVGAVPGARAGSLY